MGVCRRFVTAAAAFGLVASALASAQTPVPGVARTELRAGGGGSKPAGGTDKPAKPPAGPVTKSPVLSAAAAPPVTGRISTIAVDRLNAAATASASLAPSAPRWMPITIVNRAGGRVPTIGYEDLNVMEDGVRQKVTSIERWPLWLVVVLDVSRQIGPSKQLAAHRQIAYDLLYALGEDDNVAVVQYADTIDLIQPWTKDAHEAEQAIEEKFESGLDGQMWNSVAYASEQLLTGKVGQKIIVVITDGVDESSHVATYTRAVEKLRDTASTLYIVNLGQYLSDDIRKQAHGLNGVLNTITSPSYYGRKKELRQYEDNLNDATGKMVSVATDTGGKLWVVDPERDLDQIARLVWQQIEGQYMVAYEPVRPGDRRSTQPVRAVSAFVTRGDIEVRSPGRLYVTIASPRGGPVGTQLRKRSN